MASLAHLPSSLNTLFGREHDLARVVEMLLRPDTRLLTLTGTGGVGKTRLAIAIASAMREHFRDGGAFVRLEAIRDPALLIPTLAQTFGLQEQSGQSIDQALTAFLQAKQSLLVLDNMEQIAVAASLLVDLLTACSDLTLLVTSRTVLHVSGEQIFPVRPLPLPETSNALPILLDDVAQSSAIQLFVARAKSAQPDFALTEENCHAIAAICQRLDGLPLALELAASRITLFSPEALLARLDRRLPLLTGGAHDLPARLQTLYGAIAWSYLLLAPGVQRLFRQLAVCVGGCTLAAAEAICSEASADSVDVLAGMEALVDQSLLQRLDVVGDEPRFAMLETVREFALEQLAASDEGTAVRRAHAHFLLSLAEAAEPGLRGAEQQQWRDRLEAELGNLRAALAWTTSPAQDAEDHSIGLRLAAALWYFWFQRGLPTEGRQWLAQALAASSTSGAASAWALLGAGTLAWQQGQYPAAKEALTESISLWEDMSDHSGLAESLHVLGHVHFDQRDYAEARRLFQESRALYTQAGDSTGSIPLVGDLGMVAYHERDYYAARLLFEESLILSRRYGLKDRVADALNRLGDLARMIGDNRGAKKKYADSLKLWQELHGSPGVASALHKLGQVNRAQGDLVAAHTRLMESLRLQRDLGNRQGIAECFAAVAGIDLDLGNLERAAHLLAASATILEAIGAPLAPADQDTVAADVTSARIRLGEIVWRSVWTEGWSLPVDQMIDEALAIPVPVTPSSSERHDEAVLLSRREEEVAALVARGLTNRAIAESLVIGERTVETHVSHILAKLGFAARAQIVVWDNERHSETSSS